MVLDAAFEAAKTLQWSNTLERARFDQYGTAEADDRPSRRTD